jgi:uncharacterized protein YqhQ
MKSSNIGGQAVLEGIMMKNKDNYAVAVRKPDGEIAVDVQKYESVIPFKTIKEIPFVRGIFNFVDSLVLGMRTLMYSASFFEEEEMQEYTEEEQKKKDKKDSMMMTGTMIVSFILAIAIFMGLPYLAISLLGRFTQSQGLLALAEGIIRLAIFLLYIVSVSFMKDIRRTFMYHGAEHKCINCIEHGLDLTVENVRESSKEHKRCGTSFLLFVMIVSIILLFFVRAKTHLMRIVIRLLLIPVIAGISYELIKLAGSSENPIVQIISKPGLLLQKLTTKEPDDDMIEVAIQAVEAVFDWKAYQQENFGDV